MSASTTSISMASAAFSSGLTRERLRGATWAAVMAERGARRAAIIADLVNYDIRPEVRLNPERLEAFLPGAKALPNPLGADYEPLTTAWVAYRADRAAAIYFESLEDAGLGGPTVRMEIVDDGLGGKFWNPRATQGTPGVVEVRLPAEARPAVASK